MRILRFANYYGADNQVYSEIVIANVEINKDLIDALGQPMLMVKNVESQIILGNSKRKTVHEGMKLLYYKENLMLNKPSIYIFELDNINDDMGKKAIEIIFHR